MTAPANPPRPSRFALLMIAVAALMGAAGVVLGALAAHALTEPAKGLAETAARFAFVHALAIAIAALLFDRIGPPGSWPRRLVALAALLFAAGIVLFSGGLAALAADLYVAGTAPWGGTAFIAGWIALAAGALGACVARD